MGGRGNGHTNAHPHTSQPGVDDGTAGGFGQIGGFCTLRRRIENMIPDRLYGQRRGGTDTEAIFLIAMGDIDNEGPVEAVRLALARITAEMDQAGIGEARS